MQRFYKFLFLLVLSVFLLFSLTACGNNSSEKAVKSFLSDMKKFDLESIAEHIDISEGERESFRENLLSRDFTRETEDVFLNYFKKKAKKIDYKIVDTEQREDNATVKVLLKYVDGRQELGNAFSRLLKESFDIALLEDVDRLSKYKEIKKILQKELTSSEDKFIELEKELELVKKDDKWLIKDLDRDVLNVLLADYMDILAGMEDLSR